MRMTSLLPVLLFSFLATGCTAIYKPEAFSPKKRYAVVTIAAGEKIQTPGSQNATLSGVVKAVASSEAGFSHSAADALQAAAPMVMKSLTSQKRFVVLPESTTCGNTAYKAMAGEEPVNKFMGMKSRFLLPPGYKFFREKENASALAQKMKVDGVIVVQMFFNAIESKVYVGPVAVGKHKARTSLLVTAYDKSGEPVWAETFDGDSTDGIPFLGDAVNFKKLQPLLIQSTQAALDKMRKKRFS